MKKTILRSLACIAVGHAFIQSAHATDVFNLEGFGPISRAMGGTGVAYDIGPAGMMYNPATLGLMPNGSYFDVGVDVINTSIRATNLDTGESVESGNHGSNNGPYLAPELAYVYRKQAYTFGIGVFAQAGVGTQFGGSSFLSRTSNGIDTGLDVFSRMLVLRVPFSVAFQATDKLTIGGSIDAVWTSLNLGLLLDGSQLGSLAGQGRLTGSLVPTLLSLPGLSGGYFNINKNTIAGGGASAWGVGGKVGLTYQITPDTVFGAAYNFKTHVGDLSGQAQLTAVSSVVGDVPLSGSVRVRNFQMPAQVSAGISHKFTDQLSVSLDYQHVFWASVFKNINVSFVQSGTGANLNISLPQNYSDINIFGIGTQYIYNEKWTFRGGFHYAQGAAPANSFLAVVPETPTTDVSAGFSYSL